jgi:hypothetical protein
MEVIVPVHVRALPFSDTLRVLDVCGVRVNVFAYEPVVWVSITRAEVAVLPADAPRFPAVVDTGNTVALNIQEDHLAAWSVPRLRAADLPLASPPRRVHDASGNVAVLPRRQAKVWLHAYPEGAGLAPLNLMAAGGILVYEPAGVGEGQPANVQVTGPHLPLLGARGFFPTGLAVLVDYRRLEVTIGTEDSPDPAGLLRRLWQRGRRWISRR